jgi:hypothetical protein
MMMTQTVTEGLVDRSTVGNLASSHRIPRHVVVAGAMGGVDGRTSEGPLSLEVPGCISTSIGCPGIALISFIQPSNMSTVL